MLYILFFILFIIVFPVLLLGLRLIHFVFRVFSPLRQVYKQAKGNTSNRSGQDSRQETKSDKKKIFSSNEGEYVDFEEVGK